MMSEKSFSNGGFDFVSIQYLRAVAASMVVIFHLAPQLRRMGWGGDFGGWLSSGVDIFFVISGFIMWVATTNKAVTPLYFYKKRIIRIVPLYYALTTFIVILMLAAPSVLQSSVFNVEHVLKSYLFFPSLHPVLGAMEPVLFSGWTLNYEMFFYLLFGVALLVKERFRLTFILLVLVALGTVGLVRGTEKSVVGFYSDSIIIEFGLGIVIGFFCGKKKINLSPGVSLALVLIGFFILSVSGIFKEQFPRLVMWGLPAAAIVLGAVSLDINGVVRRHGALHLLGDASYSIYLFHGVVLSAMSQLWRRLFSTGDLSIYSFMVVAVALALVGGVLMYLYVERPLLRFFSKRTPQQLPAIAP